MDITLRWAGAPDAGSDTTYRIETDEGATGVFAVVDTVSATDRGDGVYAPYSDALAADLDAGATLLDLVDGENFAPGDYVAVGRELVRLGAQAGAVYTGCERGVAGSLPASHAAGTPVYRAHESWTGVLDMAGRRVVRMRVVRMQGALESVAAQALAVNPTRPPHNGLCALYGVVEDSEGEVKVGVPVSLVVDAPGNYSAGAGNLYHLEREQSSTDSDGYFEFFVPRNADERGGSEYTLTIAQGTDAELQWQVANVPDADSVNFLET